MLSNVIPIKPAASSFANKRKAAIREFNDAFRQNLPMTGHGCRLVITASLQSLPVRPLAGIIHAVRTFDQFTPANDAYGEHDFGSVNVEGVEWVWQIESLCNHLNAGSPDPADPSVTVRVMTIMRADDY